MEKEMIKNGNNSNNIFYNMLYVMLCIHRWLNMIEIFEVRKMDYVNNVSEGICAYRTVKQAIHRIHKLNAEYGGEEKPFYLDRKVIEWNTLKK